MYLNVAFLLPLRNPEKFWVSLIEVGIHHTPIKQRNNVFQVKCCDLLFISHQQISQTYSRAVDMSSWHSGQTTRSK